MLHLSKCTSVCDSINIFALLNGHGKGQGKSNANVGI
jgi:hypothetical protein